MGESHAPPTSRKSSTTHRNRPHEQGFFRFSAGAISAMTKLSTSMIKHQATALKVQEEKSNSHMKVWRHFPKIKKNVILLGGVEDDSTVSNEPTDEMLSILGFQNGAQVDYYIIQSMRDYNMSLEPGFCMALNKGMLV